MDPISLGIGGLIAAAIGIGGPAALFDQGMKIMSPAEREATKTQLRQGGLGSLADLY